MFRKGILALALAGVTTPAAAADNEVLLQEMRRLAERVEQLELANKRLETVLEQSGADKAKDIEARIEDVESEVIALRRPSALEAAISCHTWTGGICWRGLVL